MHWLSNLKKWLANSLNLSFFLGRWNVKSFVGKTWRRKAIFEDGKVYNFVNAQYNTRETNSSN